MKNNNSKYGKTLLIIAAILLLIGTIISLIGLSMIQFDFNKLSPAPVEYTKTEDFFEIAKNKNLELSINVNHADINIKPSKDGKIRFFYSPEYFSVDFSNETSTTDSLIISRNDNIKADRKRYYFIDFSFNENSYDSLVIELPENIIDDMTAALEYGSIEISDISNIKNLSIGCKSSDIELENLEVLNNANVMSEHGEVSISNTSVGVKLLVEQKSGNLKMYNNTINSAEIFSEHGENKISNLKGDSLYIEASSGNVKLDNVFVKDLLNINSEHGSIFLDYVDSSLIDITSKSGDVRGNINDSEDNFKISAFSGSGDNNLHSKHTGNKELRIENNHGDINIKFNK